MECRCEARLTSLLPCALLDCFKSFLCLTLFFWLFLCASCKTAEMKCISEDEAVLQASSRGMRPQALRQQQQTSGDCMPLPSQLLTENTGSPLGGMMTSN